MPKIRFPIPEIKSYSPALDVRGAGNDVYVLDGRNYVFDSKGPKAGFATRLLAGGDTVGDTTGIVQSIEIADRCFVFSPSGIHELSDNESQWILKLDLSSFNHIPYLPHKKWTAAYLSNGVYFCHADYGLYKLTFTGFTELTQENTPGLPYKPIAIAETNGRLIILGQHYVVWSAPSDAEEFSPELGGAGFQLLADRVTGQPVTLAAFQRGFLVWTEQDCLLGEFIGGDNVFRFDRATNQQIPLDANCVETLPDGSQIVCTRQGLFLIKNGQEPEKIVPIFSEFLRETLKHEPAIRIRLVYAAEQDRLYVQVRDYTNHYVRTYVLAVALDKWGQFSDRHLGIIKYAPKRGAYGYVDDSGTGHKFVEEAFDREVTPHVFTGLDSSIIIGYIKPPNLTPEADTLLEMHEILIGGEARPSWSVPEEIDLGRIPVAIVNAAKGTFNLTGGPMSFPVACETPEQTPVLTISPSMSTNQLTDNYNATNLGTDTWWDEVSTPAVNADTGEVFQFVNKSYDYVEPDYITDKVYLNVVSSDGETATQYYPGAFNDPGSAVHYLVHDDVIQVDRYDGDVWAIHDWWTTSGSVLKRNVKANNYAFQLAGLSVLRQPTDHAAPDTGLGVTNNIIGFTDNEIIIVHEVDSEKDFKLEALNKNTLARVSQAYFQPGVGNINGPIEAGSFFGNMNFCLGPDGKVYHATFSTTTTFANGTRALLTRYDPATGAYDNITPWSSAAMPIASDPGDPVISATDFGVKMIFYDRVLDKIVVLFGYRIGPLFGVTTRYVWSIGHWDIGTSTWTNLGHLPDTDWLDINYIECAMEDSVWCQTGIAILDVNKNTDALPMASPCQEYLHTLEYLIETPGGNFDPSDVTNRRATHLVVRDPAQGYAVIQRFVDIDGRYASLISDTNVQAPFLYNLFGGDSDDYAINNSLVHGWYLPNRKYMPLPAGVNLGFDFRFNIDHPYSETWNDDNSHFYPFLEP